MISDARVFWYNHVKTKIAPPPRSIADCLLLFPDGTEEKHLTSDPFLDQLISSGKVIKRKMKELQEDFEEIQTTIMSHMKDSSAIVNGKGEKIVTWSSGSRTSLDQKSFEKVHPNLFEKFKKVTNYRTFKIKEL